MSDLTANFSRREFACRCGCGSDHIRIQLVDVLQQIRDTVNRPVVVTSGVRCERHNRRVGGAARSQHLLGTAADIRVAGYTPVQIGRIADRILGRRGGVKAYATFTHVDVRSGYWRAGI